jgi:uncharacterized membrane protein
MKDSNARSIVKTITWRLTGSGATFLVSYILTHDFTTSGSIALIQMMSNTILYYFHERIWNILKWGKNG